MCVRRTHIHTHTNTHTNTHTHTHTHTNTHTYIHTHTVRLCMYNQSMSFTNDIIASQPITIKNNVIVKYRLFFKKYPSIHIYRYLYFEYVNMLLFN